MTENETWRDVPGYGGKYQASSMGRIANTFWHGRKGGYSPRQIGRGRLPKFYHENLKGEACNGKK